MPPSTATALPKLVSLLGNGNWAILLEILLFVSEPK
jgi:hypothetical protein